MRMRSSPYPLPSTNLAISSSSDIPFRNWELIMNFDCIAAFSATELFKSKSSSISSISLKSIAASATVGMSAIVP